MSFMDRVLPWRKKADVYQRWLELLNIGSQSKSGTSVNLESAIKVSAAFACMRVISQGIAQVPFKLYQSTEQNGLTHIRVARDHDLYDKLATKPNPWNTSFEFRETLALHACLGNAYVYKNVFRNQLLELILLDPERVKPVQKDDWSIVYKVTGKNGQILEYDSSLIWHVRGPSLDGFLGMETIKIAKEALGLSIAAEESHASLHKNGIRPSGVYSVDAKLNEDQHKQVTEWLKKNAAAGVGTPLILDRGAKWLNQSMTGLDAQHLEMRSHQIEEVCRFFGVLPIMIGHTGDKASTYASAEQMFMAHKVHTLDPWHERIAQSADANLLTEKERKAGYYFKFVSAALMRGSAKDRAEYFSKALGAGGSPAWMTQDEVRGLEELNPFGGEANLLPPTLGRNNASPQTP